MSSLETELGLERDDVCDLVDVGVFTPPLVGFLAGEEAMLPSMLASGEFRWSTLDLRLLKPVILLILARRL